MQEFQILEVDILAHKLIVEYPLNLELSHLFFGKFEDELHVFFITNLYT